MSVSFKGGIHPLKEIHEGKSLSKGSAIKQMIPQIVTIPMDSTSENPVNQLSRKETRSNLVKS